MFFWGQNVDHHTIDNPDKIVGQEVEKLTER
jgi:hypothetical protein